MEILLGAIIGVVFALLVEVGLVYALFWYHKRKWRRGL